MQRVVDLISHDNTLTAQCLHMANSPLFGHWQQIRTPRAAVAALGLQRMRDIALSCCMMRLVPEERDQQNVIGLWEHSLACALLSRKLARRLGVRDPEEVYIAALLHDLGLMVNLRLAPDEFREILRTAQAESHPLEKLEQATWGCTHCDTGALLATRWELAPLVIDVVRHHHAESTASEFRAIGALTAICDQLCRANGLGYGYKEPEIRDLNTNPWVAIIKQDWPASSAVSWPKLIEELTAYLNEVRKLVSVLFRFK